MPGSCVLCRGLLDLRSDAEDEEMGSTEEVMGTEEDKERENNGENGAAKTLPASFLGKDRELNERARSINSTKDGDEEE